MAKEKNQRSSVVVDSALIEKIAKLASLELNKQEIDLFTGQFKDILEIVKQVQSIGGQKAAEVDLPSTPLREDTPVRANIQAADFSPHVENGFFKAPKVL